MFENDEHLEEFSEEVAKKDKFKEEEQKKPIKVEHIKETWIILSTTDGQYKPGIYTYCQ